MARQRRLAAIAIGAALANLGLSLLLVRPLGVTGVALGTLIPTTFVCFGLIMPYALRMLGVSWRTALAEIFIPALAPLAPMLLTLVALRALIAPNSLLALMLITAVSAAVYAIGYLSIGARPFERQMYRDFAANAFHFASAHLRRPHQ